MVLDDVQFMTLLKGRRIKLTLKTSSYFGVVQRINPNRTLVLADVSDGSNGCKYPGTKLFFGREILNVEFADDENHDSNGVSEKQLDAERFQPYRKIMTLDGDEEESINIVVIDELQESFGPAVMHIKKQQVIGVGGEGVEIFKNGRLCWLQIATENKVYLFDILMLGVLAFKNGLSTILESKRILKVIHDCRGIAGNLMAQFRVKLTNVFDTQVADVMCFFSKTGGLLPDRVSTLPEVVNLHLNLPSSKSLQVKSQLTKKEMEIWYKRPCPLHLLEVMALSVVHLKPLRLVLLDTLMTDYMFLVDSYLSNSLYEPDGLEHLTVDNALELPKELKQLDKMHRERQERACKRYPITERGLLARFNPYPDPESPPAAEAHCTTQSNLDIEASSFHTPPKTETPDIQQTPRRFSFTSVSSQGAISNPQATLFNPQKEIPTELSEGLNGECSQVVLGRGRLLENKQPSGSVFPSIGRGFLLHEPRPQIPGEGAGGMKNLVGQETVLGATGCTHSKEAKPHPGCGGNELPTNPYCMGDYSPSNPSISLIQSFRSFRK